MEPEIPKNIHRVTKTLADGTERKYHYCFRGGPRFWSDKDKAKEGSPAYLTAYKEKLATTLSPALISNSSRDSTRAKIADYKASPAFVRLADRTKQDYLKYLDLFEDEFGDDPIKLFEEVEAVGEINSFKAAWSHSPRQHDYATSVVTRFLNWCQHTERCIQVHYHFNMEHYYRCDRAHLTWTPDERAALIAEASEKEKRVVLAAQGGITPQDLGLLKREHVQRTPKGRRLFFRRSKSGKPFSIPLTPDLEFVVDTTPKDQEFLLVSLEGRPLRSERASGIVRALKTKAIARQPGCIREELRLYDMRGTAATNLIRADCSLREIATYMGWGLRHASNIIETYVRLVPEESDRVAEKLRRFWQAENQRQHTS